MNARIEVMDEPGQQLVPSISVENLVNQRAAVVERMMAAFDLLREAHEISEAAGTGFPRLKIDDHRYAVYNLATENPTEVRANFVKIIDKGAWQHLMNESGLRTFMDKQARDKWSESVEKGDYPELTAANVRSTFKMMYDARGDMFERGVIKCFKDLSWHYKTNLPQKFGKRIVVTFLRSKVMSGRNSSGTSLGYVTHSRVDYLDDLNRVFHVLDGKPEPDHRSGIYGLVNSQNKTTDPPAENAYMVIKSFRNGNAHVTFKRLELVDQLNRIIAKHYPGALPEPK